MPVIARMIGGAGTGKTRWIMDTMAKVVERGIDPFRIGFVSFTRAARREAATRAAEQFGVKLDELEEHGWFRTLHSVCYRALGVGKELLAQSVDTRKWTENAVQEAVGATVEDGLAEIAFETSTDAGRALRIWDTARNRLVPYSLVHATCEAVDERTPSLEWCETIVDRYEQAKRLDGRCDFVDTLGRFAGIRFKVGGPERCAPEGDVPGLPVWLLDEQQDTSALLDAVCHRCIEPADWVYVVGDVFQSIYGWAGGDGDLFLRWPVAKQGIMPQGYRCPKAIHDLGEAILRDCSNYFDRGIAPAPHDGGFEIDRLGSSLAEVDPKESWLLLARTNRDAARLSRAMSEKGYPWLPTKGNGGWNRPAAHEAIEAMQNLQRGLFVTGRRWKRCLEKLPAKHDGADLLVRGAKTEWSDIKLNEVDERFAECWPEALPGATPRLTEMIKSGAWRGLVEHADEWCEAVEKYGEDVVKEPRIRVGTIHSVKGAEADNVLWLTTLTSQVRKAREDQAVDDEERRLAYVAVTRARKRLCIAVEPNQYRFELPV